jgi:hypothetical protein
MLLASALGASPRQNLCSLASVPFGGIVIRHGALRLFFCNTISGSSALSATAVSMVSSSGALVSRKPVNASSMLQVLRQAAQPPHVPPSRLGSPSSPSSVSLSSGHQSLRHKVSGCPLGVIVRQQFAGFIGWLDLLRQT